MDLKTGTVLGSWRIGALVGSGAFGAVYTAEYVSTKHRRPEFECVIKVAQLPPRGAKMTKKVKTVKRAADTIYAERMAYGYLQHANIPRIPSDAYGEAEGCRYLAMENVGRPILGPMSEQTVAMLCAQLVDTMEYIHSKGKLYVDCKPENFLVSSDGSKIYCVDMGLVESYISATGRHVQCVQKAQLVGTPDFLSLDCHKGFTHARKDDIEGVLYAMIFAIKGHLPWIHASSDLEGAAIKENFPLEDVCSGIHENWAIIIEIIRSYAFQDQPDYDIVKVLLGAIQND